VLSDGVTARPLPLAEDHKQVGDGDVGPMTGGMGTVAPVDALGGGGVDEVMRSIVAPTLDGMRDEGSPFVGTLFVGLMLTDDGVQVLEYNVRFGDPETQVVLPLLDGDLFEVLAATADGRLAEASFGWQPRAAACVVMAAPGYPGSYPSGLPIDIPRDLGRDVMVFHAGTARDRGQLVSAGGRVLGVTALGDDRAEAIDRAYGAVARIEFSGAHYRRDIGRRR
jgi:phosphoribosylamine---glycine ligase